MRCSHSGELLKLSFRRVKWALDETQVADAVDAPSLSDVEQQ